MVIQNGDDDDDDDDDDDRDDDDDDCLLAKCLFFVSKQAHRILRLILYMWELGP